MAAGPFFFAWAGSDETTFNESHWREDEEVFSFAIEHSEGDFAGLEITIRNPRVGFLAPGRETWAWLSYDRGFIQSPPDQVSESESEFERGSESESGDIVPLFFGRLVAIPDDIHEELIILHFIARPLDFAAQKIAVADTKRVQPYWDPIWFSAETRDDPDNVLESRPELWHIDRITHVVTTSNIIIGEAGTLSFGESDVFWESMSISYNSSSTRAVEVEASVAWDQTASGELDLSMPAPFKCFDGSGLENSWPKDGASVGGGWIVLHGAAVRLLGKLQAVWGFSFGVGAPGGGADTEHQGFGHAVIVPEYYDHISDLVPGGGVPITRAVYVPAWYMSGTLVLRYEASRKRSERISFVLEADVQSIVTEPGDEDVIQLSFSSAEIASPIDPGNALPIGDARNRVYFSSVRGAQSLEYLIMIARAKLLTNARAVDIEFEIPFNLGIDSELSCRKNVVITDYRLPGGLAGGKVKSYRLSADGESGQFLCGITMGCTIGKGNTVTALPGNPTYCEGYVEGYRIYKDAFIMPVVGEVLYESIEGLGATDDGIDFNHLTPFSIGASLSGGHSAADQKVAMGGTAPDPGTVFERLNTVPTIFTFKIQPVTGGPFETVFSPAVSLLMIPKTIDLEASL